MANSVILTLSIILTVVIGIIVFVALTLAYKYDGRQNS